MVYEIMYYGGMALAIIMFIVSLLLFIKLRIPKVIGDVTGITAKKTIKNIRENNIKTGNKSYKTSPINIARGRTTDKIFTSSKLAQSSLEKNITEELNIDNETTLLCNVESIEPKYYFALEVDLMIINTSEAI